MLGVAVIATLLAACILVAPFGAVLVAQSRARGAADAAALAAADVAIGLRTGSPCTVAGEVAAIGGATVAECAVDGVIVTVRVTVPAARWPIAATATAGPPG